MTHVAPPAYGTIFRCPRCHAAIPLPREAFACGCGFTVDVADGIPLLVADPVRTATLIEEARSSPRSSWYEESQVETWSGPWRHHLKKRVAYVEGVLDGFARRTARPLVGLDLACGDGANLPWLSRRIAALYGSDYNLLRLRRAAQVPGIAAVVLADVTDYPAVDEAFDVVFFNHALEHVPDDARALAELRRILKPGGLGILGVPNEGAFFWQLAYRLQPAMREQSDHVHHYTAASIRERCERAGLRVERVDPIGWGVPHWTLDGRLRQYKWVDDTFEVVGRALLPSQATSLYVILSK